MLTGKQRGYLKKLAQTVQPAVIVGRAGVTDAVMQTIDEYLTAHELLKVAKDPAKRKITQRMQDEM